MKFQVGDRVQIISRQEAEVLATTIDCAMVPYMVDYSGKEAVITAITPYPAYKIDLDNGFFLWDDSCFEDDVLPPMA